MKTRTQKDEGWKVELLPTAGEHMAAQFTGELLTAIAGTETYAEGYQALWDGYLDALRPHLRGSDNRAVGVMPRPSPLQLLISDLAMYAFFRAWVRSNGLDPDAMLAPIT